MPKNNYVDSYCVKLFKNINNILIIKIEILNYVKLILSLLKINC